MNLPTQVPKDYYDSWRDTFNPCVFELVQKVHGSDNFIPGPSHGQDGGIDAEYVNFQQGRFLIQIKWREISNSSSKLQAEIYGEFSDWIADMIQNKEAKKCLFITNVGLTGNTHEKFKAAITSHPELDCEYWEFEKINSLLRRYEDIHTKFCPFYTRDQIESIREEKRKTVAELKSDFERNISEKEFLEIQYKVKNLFVDRSIQQRFYYSFIYFLEPFYLDERSANDRSALRKLLDISPLIEDGYIQQLKSNKKITQTERLLSVTDREDAKESLNGFIDGLQIPIEKVVDLFEKIQ